MPERTPLCLRPLAALLILLGIGAVAACEQGPRAAAPPLPSTVNCTDAADLRQRGSIDRRRSAELTSDQEKVDTANRAVFLASLATIADLKCKVTAADATEADVALQRTLDAARKATSTRGFYERSNAWTEANFTATEVIALLVKRIPNSTSK
jgi:hypothetical protein